MTSSYITYILPDPKHTNISRSTRKRMCVWSNLLQVQWKWFWNLNFLHIIKIIDEFQTFLRLHWPDVNRSMRRFLFHSTMCLQDGKTKWRVERQWICELLNKRWSGSKWVAFVASIGLDKWHLQFLVCYRKSLCPRECHHIASMTNLCMWIILWKQPKRLKLNCIWTLVFDCILYFRCDLNHKQWLCGSANMWQNAYEMGEFLIEIESKSMRIESDCIK